MEDARRFAEQVVRYILETSDCAAVDEIVIGKAAVLQIVDDLVARTGPYPIQKAVESGFPETVRYQFG